MVCHSSGYPFAQVYLWRLFVVSHDQTFFCAGHHSLQYEELGCLLILHAMMPYAEEGLDTWHYVGCSFLHDTWIFTYCTNKQDMFPLKVCYFNQKFAVSSLLPCLLTILISKYLYNVMLSKYIYFQNIHLFKVAARWRL